MRQLSDYCKANVDKNICDFVQVLQTLSQDNMAGGDSMQFIKKII